MPRPPDNKEGVFIVERTSPMVAVYQKSLIAAFALSIASTSAFASDVQFSYKAHELQTSNGVEALYNRLEFKAKKACQENGAKALYAKQMAKACRTNFINEIVGEIDDRRLNRAHAAATRNDQDYAAN